MESVFIRGRRSRKNGLYWNAGGLPGGGPKHGFVLPVDADVQGLAGTLLELLVFLGKMGAYIEIV
jgi:hypothetical protein